MSRKRWIWIGALAVVALIIGAAAWSARDTVAYANIATGYAAKQTCSCRFVSGRTMDSCMADFSAEDRNNFSVAENGDHIEASVLFGAIKAEALYEEGYGCRLLN
jgi:hypothetical protein